jgi:uncharacterized protein (TIGR02246 family)
MPTSSKWGKLGVDTPKPIIETDASNIERAVVFASNGGSPMHHFSRLRVSVLFLFFVAYALSGFAADGGAKSVDAAWMKAMKANDLEAVLACYASDAVLWMPGSPEASGQKAIRAAYQGLFAANTVQDASTTDTHYKTSGSLSVGWGHFNLTLAPKAGGAPVSMNGRFTEAAERQHGRWVYVADHASAEPSPSDAAH